MLTPPRRTIGSWLAAATVVTLLAAGCTASDWRYDAPPGAGVVRDAGPIKARNILVVADDQGTGVLLGALGSSTAVEITQAVVQGQGADGTAGQAVPLDLTSAIPAGGTLNLQAEKVLIEGAGLVPGQLATVALQFSDGTELVLETPVMSAEHEDYGQAFEDALG